MRTKHDLKTNKLNKHEGALIIQLKPYLIPGPTQLYIPSYPASILSPTPQLATNESKSCLTRRQIPKPNTNSDYRSNPPVHPCCIFHTASGSQLACTQMLEPRTFEAYISPSSVLCFSTPLGNQSPSEKDVLVLYDVKGKMGLGPCPSTYCYKPDSPSNMGASANEAGI